jgi:hypothetical protein
LNEISGSADAFPENPEIFGTAGNTGVVSQGISFVGRGVRPCEQQPAAEISGAEKANMGRSLPGPINAQFLPRRDRITFHLILVDRRALCPCW